MGGSQRVLFLKTLILKDVYTDIRGNETHDEKNGRYRFTSAQFIDAEP